jgi:hypothetical protein
MTEHPGPPQSPGTSGAPRRIRAGDTDRDRVVAALQTHREAGRLTPDEFEERMEAALRATWLDELPPLLSDLPDDRAERPGPFPGPSADKAHGAPRGACGRLPFGPIAAFVALALVIGSVGAVAHGHFPFPLIWLAVLAFWFGPWGRRRRWRRWAQMSEYRDAPWGSRRRP